MRLSKASLRIGLQLCLSVLFLQRDKAYKIYKQVPISSPTKLEMFYLILAFLFYVFSHHLNFTKLSKSLENLTPNYAAEASVYLCVKKLLKIEKDHIIFLLLY